MTTKTLPRRETQHMIIVRVVTRQIGAKTYTFWKAKGGTTFAGRGCHMKAMSEAVRMTPSTSRAVQS